MKKILLTAILAASVILLLTCENGFNILDEVETEVKIANDKFLIIESVKVDSTALEPNAVNINPAGTFKFQFDRALNESTINSSNILIEDSGGTPFSTWNYVYNNVTHLLSVEPDPFLVKETEYIIKLTGIKGADNSGLQETFISGFETGLIASGSVVLTGNDGNSNTGYSISSILDVDVTVNDAFQDMQYRFSLDGGLTWESGWSSSLSPGGNASDTIDIFNFAGTNYYSEDGNYTVTTQFRGRDSISDDFTNGSQEDDIIYVDLTSPTISSVSIDGDDEYSTDTIVSISVSVSDNDPTLCSYRFWTTDNTTPSSWFTLSSSSATFTASLNGADNEDKYVYVEVKDAAGNPTDTDNDFIKVDTVSPGKPSITTSTINTPNTALRWDWDPGSGTYSNYERKLNDGSWYYEADDYYEINIKTPDIGGKYTLYVRSEDAAGNVSDYDYHSISYFPSTATDLMPDNNANFIKTFTNIDWPSFTNADGYYLYMWEDGDPVPTNHIADVSKSDFNPPSNLPSFTTINWKYQPYIESYRLKIVQGTSPVYQFRTGP